VELVTEERRKKLALIGATASELERTLGHLVQRHIQRYTNPPENAAGYVEWF
jgi:hypothetical protein